MPEKTLPQAAKFFLADDIRSNGTPKPTLFGLYPDDVIVLLTSEDKPDPTKEEPATLEGIAILCSFDAAYGAFESEFRLLQPDGESIFSSTSSEVVAEKLGPMLLVIKFQPFAISQLGHYTYSISIDGKIFEYTFEVRRVNLPPSRKDEAEMPVT